MSIRFCVIKRLFSPYGIQQWRSVNCLYLKFIDDLQYKLVAVENVSKEGSIESNERV